MPNEPVLPALPRHRLVTVAVLALLAAAVVVLAPPSPAVAATFADARGGAHSAAIEALAAEGVTEGCRADEFCPDHAITRAQAASLLVRAFGADAAPGRTPFSDIGNSPHADNIAAAAAAGWTNGCSADRFCPHDNITRGQLASMIDRAYSPPSTSSRWFDDVYPVHADAVDRLAAAGIAAGCQSPLTSFCGTSTVTRAQTASFIARALDLVPRVEVASYDQRAAEQAKRDAASVTIARASVWDSLAQCESGGNWSINTGNGYYGGLQFSLASWQWVGGTGYPHQASREEQIRRAELLLDRQGWGAWPACSSRLGLR